MLKNYINPDIMTDNYEFIKGSPLIMPNDLSLISIIDKI